MILLLFLILLIPNISLALLTPSAPIVLSAGAAHLWTGTTDCLFYGYRPTERNYTEIQCDTETGSDENTYFGWFFESPPWFDNNTTTYITTYWNVPQGASCTPSCGVCQWDCLLMITSPDDAYSSASAVPFTINSGGIKEGGASQQIMTDTNSVTPCVADCDHYQSLVVCKANTTPSTADVCSMLYMVIYENQD